MLRANGVAFPNDFRRDSLSNQLHESYGEKSNEELEDLGIEVSVAGRMMTRRITLSVRYLTQRRHQRSAVVVQTCRFLITLLLN